MSAVPAGRLSIEIVAEIARLQKDLDAAKRAVKAASNDIGASARAANDNLATMGKGMAAVSTTSKAMRANFINLGRQVQDVGTMFALGAPPMQIFASQGAQIVDVLAMMKAEANQTGTSLTKMAVGGLARVGPLAVAIGVLTGAFALLSDEVNENAEVQVSWKNTALGAYDAVAASLKDNVSAAFDALGINVGEVWTYIVDTTKTAANLIIGAASLAPRMIITAFKVLPAGIADVFFSAVNGGIRAINGLVERSVAAINGYASLVNPILEKVGLAIPKLIAPRIGEVENAYAGAAVGAAKAFTGTFADTFGRNFIGEAADAIRPFAEARQLKENAEAAGEKAGKAGGRAMGRAMGEAAAEAFPKAFLDAVNDNARLASDNAEALAKAFGDNLKTIMAEEEARESLRKEYQALIREMQIEQNLIGATAQEREIAALYLEREGFMARYAALGIEEATRMWEAYFAARKGLIDGEAAFDNEAANIQRLAGQLEGLAGLIPGRAGNALGNLLNLEIGVRNGEAEKLSEAITRTFPKLADTIGKAFQGAQVGSAVDGIFKTLGIKSSNTGAQIGGAIGSFLPIPGGQIIGSIIGSLVGGAVKATPRASATIEVIGGDAMQTAIRGSSGKLKGIAEGLADGLISGLAGIADTLGGELGSFGGISIGVRNKTFRVDPTGQGRTKGLPSFATEEEAIAEALRIAISRGAIKGIRAGTDALLRAGGDLETQLQKALAFEGVFQRLAEETDPLAFALGNLDKEFAALRDIFAEAQASTADYAALEQLYQIERNKLLEQFNDTVEEGNNLLRERQSLEARILELQGDAAGALAIQRQLELDAMDASLRPLLQQIFALEDTARAAELTAQAQEEAANAARALAEEEQRLTDQRQGLEVELLRALGKETEAVALQRQLELAALPATLRGIKEQIFAAQDAAAAAQEAARAEDERNRALAEAAQLAEQVAEAERNLARQRRALEADILELTGDTLGAVALRRQLELEQLDESLRPLQARIFALQDERDAAAAVAAAQAEAARIAEQAAADAIRAAEDAAQEIARIAAERNSIEIRLLEAQGDALGALALQRAQELASIAESNRARLQEVFAAEDAARAARELADAQAEATRVIEEAARVAARIADERAGLERRILELTGDTAAIRALELAALDESNRALLVRIFALEDEQRAVEDARATQAALADAQAEAARAAQDAQQAYEELLRDAQDALRRAVAAERSLIEARLDPLRSELERLVSAVTPEAADITASLAIRDFLSEGLSLAEKLSDASRGVLGDTERVIAAQRELARRELFRMVETRRVNGDIIDRLISEATAFGNDFANPVDLLREQATTANLLAELAKVQEQTAREAQAAEDARAADARNQVLAQIAVLEAQIAVEEAQLATLDATLERFGLLNDSVLSVADAVRQLEAVTAQGFGIRTPSAGQVGGGITTGGGGVLGTGTGTTLSTDALRQINNLLLADQERRAANGLFGGFMGAIDPTMFEALVSGELVGASLSLATLAGNAEAILAMAGGDISRAGEIISGPLPQDTDAPFGSTATAEEIAALKAEQEKTNEYLRELVKVNLKQERDLKELVIQGEAA